jgi:integrase
MQLTDAAVRRLKPDPNKRRIIHDGSVSGLFLVIQPSGAKSWMMRFRDHGKLKLGDYDDSGRELEGDPVIGAPLTLAAAHVLATKVQHERARGHNPISAHREAKRRQQAEQLAAVTGSFAAAVHDYLSEHARRKIRRWFEIARLLGVEPETLGPIPDGLAARWSDRPLSEIDSHALWEVLEEARKVGVPGIPARTPGLSDVRPRALHSALSGLFTWLVARRRITVNPMAGLRRPAPPKARERVLTTDELRWFWLATEQIGAPFGPLFQTLLLTGQRLREVAGMHSDELDAGLWSLPGTRTKNGRPHTVPLSSSVSDIIAHVRPEGFVFSSDGETKPSGFSKAKRDLDAAMLTIARRERGRASITPWVLHDLRRTAVTGMAELGVRSDVVELTVNHVSGSRGGVAGTYNRSELMPERMEALERWSRHVGGIVAGKPDKVVALPSKRGKP